MVGSRRIDPRAVIRTEILVRQSTAQLFQVTMSDISVSGFKFKSFTSLDDEKMVFVKISGLQTLAAHIRWMDYQDYGCEFTNPLHPAVFDHLVSGLKKLG
ncbi:MAG: PilZ domain-containing protein [Parasphingorhabdus sp.]